MPGPDAPPAPTPDPPPATLEMPEVMLEGEAAPRRPWMVCLDWLLSRCFSSTFSDSSWSMSACRASIVSSNSLRKEETPADP